MKYSTSPINRTFWKAFAYPIGTILSLGLKLADRTCTTEILGSEKVDVSQPRIFVNWHKHLPLLIVHHGAANKVEKNSARCLLMSEAPYMDPIEVFCKQFGLKVIRGGSKKESQSGASSIEDLEKILKSSNSVMLAVDGPTGPGFQVKRGCLELARLTGAKIVPVSFHCRKGGSDMSRWDRRVFPTYFDHVTVRYGEEIAYNPSKPFEVQLEDIKEALNKIDETRHLNK